MFTYCYKLPTVHKFNYVLQYEHIQNKGDENKVDHQLNVMFNLYHATENAPNQKICMKTVVYSMVLHPKVPSCATRMSN